MGKFDFIYCCDSYTEIGFGHLSRGIDFTNAFSARYPFYKMAIRGVYSESAIRFISENLSDKIKILNNDDESNSSISFVDTMFFSGSLDINYDFFRKIKKYSKKIIFFWDVLEVSLPSEVDIYINPLPYSVIRGNNETQKHLVGFDFLQVSELFYNADIYDISADIICIFGADKVGSGIINLLQILNQAKFNKRNIKVLLSPLYSEEFKTKLSSKFPSIVFLQNIKNVSELINKASLVISTYGNSTFQSLAAKKPNFSIAFQDFQKKYASKLEEEGYSVNLGTFGNIDESKLDLISNTTYLLSQNEKLKKTFKTPGINNLIELINNELQII